MGVRFRVDAESGTVYITTNGSPTIDEQREVWEQIASHPDARVPLRVLDDRRTQERIASTSEVRTATVTAGKMVERLRGARIAAVVPQTAAFGMSRMFQIYTEELPLELRAFYDFDEAVRWLSDADEQDSEDAET